MAAPRLRRAQNQQEFERAIDDLATQGYEIIDQGESSALLREKTWGTAGGHVLWGLLTVWWTFGIGNLLYALAAHFSAKKVMVKLDH